MALHGKTRQHLVAVGVSLDQGSVGVQLLAPHQSFVLAPVNDLLKELAEDVDAVAVTNTSHRGVVGQGLVQVVAEIPAHTETVGANPLKLALRAHPFEEQNELELKEHDRVDRGPTACGIAIAHQVAHKAQIECALDVAVEVVCRHEVVECHLVTIARHRHGFSTSRRINELLRRH